MKPGDRNRPALGAGALLGALLLSVAAFLCPGGVWAQSHLPEDRIHVSVALGGYSFLGVGYTRWVEEHQTLEITLFPLVRPGEGFPFGVRVGHAWVPSDEVWRAKLGGSFTLVVNPARRGWNRLTPIFAFAPGLQYDPECDRSIRADLWLSYFPTEGVFAPTTLEVLTAWRR